LWFNFDTAVYTALVNPTDYNISLFPTRPYFSQCYLRFSLLFTSASVKFKLRFTKVHF